MTGWRPRVRGLKRVGDASGDYLVFATATGDWVVARRTLSARLPILLAAGAFLFLSLSSLLFLLRFETGSDFLLNLTALMTVSGGIALLVLTVLEKWWVVRNGRLLSAEQVNDALGGLSRSKSLDQDTVDDVARLLLA